MEKDWTQKKNDEKEFEKNMLISISIPWILGWRKKRNLTGEVHDLDDIYVFFKLQCNTKTLNKWKGSSEQREMR